MKKFLLAAAALLVLMPAAHCRDFKLGETLVFDKPTLACSTGSAATDLYYDKWHDAAWLEEHHCFYLDPTVREWTVVELGSVTACIVPKARHDNLHAKAKQREKVTTGGFSNISSAAAQMRLGEECVEVVK